MHELAQLDLRHVWHPFTQMADWLATEPVVIHSGKGAVLCDVHGRKYLDANSSIWTNLHGHNHPSISRAIERQLKKIAHSSYLGLANEPASILAGKLVQAANPTGQFRRRDQLSKVFYSDDGSTAMEVALKLAYEFARRTGRARKPKFLSLGGAYHGDTIGAASLGHSDLFNGSFAGLMFKTDKVMSPSCYRCRFNRAKPERGDARDYRKCNWECVDQVARKFSVRKKHGEPYAGLIVEPRVQGAAGIIPAPDGWLRRVAEIARSHSTPIIADEILTGFGRATDPASGFLFASHQENVQPDYLAVAKGMTGGYLPMAATLVKKPVFDAFLGKYEAFRTFFHGHSYTGNALGAAAAVASLDLLNSQQSRRARLALSQLLKASLKSLQDLTHVGDVRQVGLIAGIELVRDWRTREPYDLRERAGIRVCDKLKKLGVLTRPIGNVVVLMPPYCTTAGQMDRITLALRHAITGIL